MEVFRWKNLTNSGSTLAAEPTVRASRRKRIKPVVTGRHCGLGGGRRARQHAENGRMPLMDDAPFLKNPFLVGWDYPAAAAKNATGFFEIPVVSGCQCVATRLVIAATGYFASTERGRLTLQ